MSDDMFNGAFAVVKIAAPLIAAAAFGLMIGEMIATAGHIEYIADRYKETAAWRECLESPHGIEADQ